jgi:hypothetical protein
MKLIRDQHIPGLALIGFCFGLFALGGYLVAIGLNWLVPGYYPGVYPPNLESYAGAYAIPLAVGQGSLMGLLVGAVLAVGLVCLRQLNLATIARALRCVAICGLLCATIGVVIGLCLGTFNPNYYYEVFDPGQRHHDFRPVDVGIGLGCTEGLMIGLFAGAVAAVGITWYYSRRAAPPEADLDRHPYDRPLPAEPW